MSNRVSIYLSIYWLLMNDSGTGIASIKHQVRRSEVQTDDQARSLDLDLAYLYSSFFASA